MADVTTSVTAVVSVVDKATPAIAQITDSLKGIEQAQQQINATASKMAADVPHSLAEVQAAAAAHGGNIWNLPTHGDLTPVKDLATIQADYWKEAARTRGAAMPAVPDIAPAAQAAVDETNSIFAQLEKGARHVWENIKQGFSSAFDWIKSTAKSVGGSIATAFEGPLGFIAGFGIASIIDSATTGLAKLVETVDKLGPMAKDIGISIAELQRLNEWAKEAGVPIQHADYALADLSKTLGKIALGAPGTKAAQRALTDLLGEDWGAQIAGKSVPEVVRQLASAFQALDDPQRAAADAAGLFVGRWREMLPLLMQGPEAMAAADKAGTIGPKLEGAVGDYIKALEQLRTSYEAFQTSLGAALVPVLTPVLQDLTKFVQEHGPQIAAMFQGAVTGVEKFIGALETVAGWLNSINDLANKSGTWMRENVWSAMGEGLKGLWDILQAPLPDIWGAIATNAANAWSILEPILAKFWQLLQDIAKWTGLGGLVTGFETIAGSISKAADAWQRWQGTPAAPAPAPAGGPGAVSPGGGPLTWENLGQPPPLLGPMPQAANGQVNVVIENKNPPPGTRTTAKASGPGVTADVGQSMPWTAPTYSGPWAPAGAT